MKQMHHPNVVRMIDMFESDGNVYIVSEYCEKGELAQLIKSLKEQ